MLGFSFPQCYNVSKLSLVKGDFLMSFQKIIYPDNKEKMYRLLKKQAIALTEDVPYLMSNLANISALLGSALSDINWVGFYLIPKYFPSHYPLDKLSGKEDLLIVGPFQGLPACVEIKIGNGVCGSAVAANAVMLVPNVHEFPGHIACDSASNSEIVLPIHNPNGDVVGVLDIDSPLLERFDEEDKEGLLKIIHVLEGFIS